MVDYLVVQWRMEPVALVTSFPFKDYHSSDIALQTTTSIVSAPPPRSSSFWARRSPWLSSTQLSYNKLDIIYGNIANVRSSNITSPSVVIFEDNQSKLFGHVEIWSLKRGYLVKIYLQRTVRKKCIVSYSCLNNIL